MDEFLRIMREQLTVEPARIPVVVIAAIGAYVSFLALVKIFGTRVLSRMTAFDAVVVVMFGAVAGRVIIGHPPTLVAGIIGLATLMLMEATFGSFRKMRSIRRIFDTRPEIVFVHGAVVEKALKKTHLSRSDIRLAVRRAGIPRLADVQCIILEPTGDLSVFRAGVPIDPRLLRGVSGTKYLYEGKDPAKD